MDHLHPPFCSLRDKPLVTFSVLTSPYLTISYLKERETLALVLALVLEQSVMVVIEVMVVEVVEVEEYM